MLGWLKKRQILNQMNSGLVMAFSKIKEDLSSQKRFLEEFYENHHGFKRTTALNHQRIAEWIRHFDVSIRKLEKDLLILEKKINNDMTAFSATSLKLFKETRIKNINDVEALKKVILNEVEVFLKENKLKSKETTNGDNIINVKSLTPEPLFDSLSNPEKALIGVLFSTETPLSYSQIAERTGKSLNTLRVYMNQLKVKGFIDESSLPNGIKLFGLRHKAKVKKLYNI